jgi:hypothetical protein
VWFCYSFILTIYKLHRKEVDVQKPERRIIFVGFFYGRITIKPWFSLFNRGAIPFHTPTFEMLSVEIKKWREL